ncbi:MAG: hypothetical protein IKW90_07490 [Lachnospiraceae bacterium]|nr:hypothetical protein [Lachnospiraceae bacterium]
MTATQYSKPNMTNLPRELGEQIFAEIQNSTKPDRKKMHEISMQLEEEMMLEREREKRNATD